MYESLTSLDKPTKIYLEYIDFSSNIGAVSNIHMVSTSAEFKEKCE